MNLNELTYVAALAAGELYGLPKQSRKREHAAAVIRDGLLALQQAGHRFEWTPPPEETTEPPEAGQ